MTETCVSCEELEPNDCYGDCTNDEGCNSSDACIDCIDDYCDDCWDYPIECGVECAPEGNC